MAVKVSSSFAAASSSSTRKDKDAASAALLRQKYAEHARKVVNKVFGDGSDTNIRDGTSEYPKFSFSEVSVGAVLGKGAFGTAREVRAFDVSADAHVEDGEGIAGSASDREGNGSNNKKKQKRKVFLDLFNGDENTNNNSFSMLSFSQRSFGHNNWIEDPSEFSDGEQSDELVAVESRKFIADHCIRHRGSRGGGANCDGHARYAVEMLSPDVAKDPAKFCQGIVDMVVETRFLSYLEHTNIIKLRAVASTDPFVDEHYFIVMDRLYDTLQTRLKTWQKLSSRSKGALAKLVTDRDGTKLAAMHEQRMVAAFDLSAAIAYLHSNNIVYRDIKAENIGFDIVS